MIEVGATPGKFEVKRYGVLKDRKDGMAVSSGDHSIPNFAGLASGYVLWGVPIPLNRTSPEKKYIDS